MQDGNTCGEQKDESKAERRGSTYALLFSLLYKRTGAWCAAFLRIRASELQGNERHTTVDTYPFEAKEDQKGSVAKFRRVSSEPEMLL